ncbi:MAG: Formate hydrogenlyase subunit 3/multisubunit Na+/H+ antiporter, MnhD subunit [Parcubacteria group bacterium GW2011_GWC2_38_7]|nr:MAG: Formate hydrogenlyase subunit 3/multisubunit Na+/H+ antiporter, MnhD subunit [Parcubacteria group bacterium GW2011_GWC2_38_7]
MVTFLSSGLNFLLLLSFFALGAFGSLLVRKNDRLANAWQSFFGIVGALWGVVFSIVVFMSNGLLFTANSTAIPFLTFAINIDRLAAFFVFIVSLITLFCSIYGIGYIKHYYQKYNIGSLGFFFHLFVLGMLLVVTVSNGLFFLVAWELMSIASYFLVVYDRNDENNVKAGFLYLVMTHVGTAFIVLALLLMYKFTGSFDFASIKEQSLLIPVFVKDIIFVLALVGFGTKAGIIPFHIWLPSAHPAAPSHVSALMSGVMIKTGIFMMIRIFLDILQPVPLWWGITILIVGLVSALMGVLYALTEHDIKRLLAYHSIENIGIILLGLGSSLVFVSLGNMPLALFGLGAALFHTLNHATFKSLLFLSAGSVINQTHSRNMEEYGGLIKYMPQTAFFFLVGSMAISALPPFNGFFSEWLTFQILLQGVASASIFLKSIFVLASGALALTGGLALACFVKAFGATFLARPRSLEATHAKESSFSQLSGMGLLAIFCLLFGLLSGYIGPLLAQIGNNLGAFINFPTFIAPVLNNKLVAPNSYGSVSALALFAIFILVLIIVIILVKYIINRKQKIKLGATWDCGVDLKPRMEITATGFARSIILIFSGVLRPSMQQEIEYHDAKMRYLPKSSTVNLSLHDVYRVNFYQPLNKFITVLSLRVKTIQGGNINVYISYILVAVIISLFLAQ